MKIDDNKFIKAMNEQYRQNKRIEILLEQTRMASEAKNETIAQEARDAYTLELIEGGVIA